MASSSIKPTYMICAVCMKEKEIVECEECEEIFCSKYSIHHHHELMEKLDEIEIIYQTVLRQPQEQSLLNQIDQWEENSIAKIHQAAEEARKKVLEEKINLEQNLKDITNQLREAPQDDSLVEKDLDQWIQKLDQLEKKLLDPKTIFIEEKSPPLVKKIRIEHEDTSDIFQYVCGDIQIRENGYLIIKDDWIGFSEVLGKREYINGQHRIKFQIKELFENGWILFGIISKLEPMNINSYISLSSYGWTTQNQICIAGQYHKEQYNDIINNDIITLIIDCDQTKIQMKNECTGHIMELFIDIKKSPFPWKLHFNLLTASTSIRILSVDLCKWNFLKINMCQNLIFPGVKCSIFHLLTIFQQ